MKRKLSFLGMAAMVLLALYSGAAWYMLRGAGAYRLGTQLGTILSASWQFTALAALILLLLFAVSGLLRRSSRKKTPVAQAAASELPAQKTDRKWGKKRGKAAPAGPGDKIPPARPAAAEPDGATAPLPDAPAGDATVLLAPQAPVGDATVLLDQQAPTGDETVLLDQQTPVGNETVLLDPAGTVSQPKSPAPSFKIAPAKPPLTHMEGSAPAAPGLCSNCGAELKPGQKFCTKCGNAVKGGVV